MNSPAQLLPILALCSLAVAQAPLEVIGFLDPASQPFTTWRADVNAPYAALRYGELPGEHTLVLLHPTIDVSLVGPVVARGLVALMPFFEDPRNLSSPQTSKWQSDDTALALLNVEYATGANREDVWMPPSRVAAHLSAFIYPGQSTTPVYAANYGTHTSGSVATLQLVDRNQLALPSVNTDERNALWHATWQEQSSIAARSFNTQQAGRQATFLAAHSWWQATNALPLDQNALDELGTFLDSKLGYVLYVQAVHVKPPPSSGGTITVRFGRRTTIRRRSFSETNNDAWWGLKGPDRHVPWLATNGSINVYIAPRGGEAHVLFSQAMSSLTDMTPLIAYFPTTTGSVQVSQIANPVVDGELLEPHRAIFLCPEDAIDGIVFIAHVNNPYVPLVPEGGWQSGAIMSPFDPHPEHMPESAPVGNL